MRHVLRHTLSWFFRAIGVLFAAHVWNLPSLADAIQVDEEVVAKWKAYEEFARSLQGTEWSTTTTNSGKVEKRKIIRKQNRQCVLSCYMEEDKPFEQCRIANPWYAALLKRSKSNPDEVSLSEFSGDPQADFPGAVGSTFSTAIPSFSPHFYVGLTPLSRFVSDPQFIIKKMTKSLEKDRQLIRVDYTHTSDNPKNGTSTTTEGLLILDPARCWCIIRRKGVSIMTLRGSRETNSESEVEYEMVDHPSGFPLIKSSKGSGKRQSYRDNNAPTRSYTRKSEYEWEVNDHVPNEEFTLSAFGLPEPKGFTPPAKSHVWVWLSVAVAALAALAILFAWLKRRRAAAPQTQSKPTATPRSQ